jgi:hypothetical protein
MTVQPLQFISNLPFGEGAIGATGFSISGQEEQNDFAQMLNMAVRPITKPKTASCVDGRAFLRFADGTDNPDVLENYVTHQLAGGLVLATTKAAVAAGLVIVRDAKDFKSAYLTMFDYLSALGYEDGGHAGCGASKNVKSSVEKELPLDILRGVTPAFRPLPNDFNSLLLSNAETKRRLLEEGFYDNWSHEWHEGFLNENVPQNFAILETDEGPTSGHYEEAVVLIGQAGYGLAKNSLIKKTGQQVFAETTHTPATLVSEIAQAVGMSSLERAYQLMRRLLLKQ